MKHSECNIKNEPIDHDDKYAYIHITRLGFNTIL